MFNKHMNVENDPIILLKMVIPVIVIWGGNFAVIRIGVNEIGPFTLAAMRFAISSIPFIFFIKRPDVPLLFLVMFALTFGLGQFGFLFLGVKLGLSSGLASLIVQFQVVFTPIFAFMLMQKKISKYTVISIFISLIGLGFVMAAQESNESGLIPFFLGLAAAASWGFSNVIVSFGAENKYSYNPISLVVWASLILPVPFIIFAYSFGELTNITSVKQLLPAVLPALYLGVIATVIAYYFWVKALSTFPASSVAPFSLLIPIIGLILGNLIFNETLVSTEIIGCSIVIAGLFVHFFGLVMQQKKT